MRARIRNLERFQHYKNRRPPWVKLHREILDNQAFVGLDSAAWRLGLELVLLASETTDGTVEATPEALSWRLRRPVKMADIEALIAVDFLRCLQPASNPLATCTGLEINWGSEERRDRVETETETPLTPLSGGHHPPDEKTDRKRMRLYRRLVRQGCDPGVARERVLEQFPEVKA